MQFSSTGKEFIKSLASNDTMSYFNNIRSSQSKYKLWDAFDYCRHMKDEIGDTLPVEIRKYIETILERFNPDKLDKETWNSIMAPLDTQVELYKMLDTLGNLVYKWREMRLQYGAPKASKSKDYRSIAEDMEKVYLDYDQYKEDKWSLILTGLQRFRKYLADSDIAGILKRRDKKDLMALNSKVFEYIAEANLSDDLGIKNVKAVKAGKREIIDERNKFISFLEQSLARGDNKIAIATDNVGSELLWVLFFSYLLVDAGFDVTLLGKSSPTLRSDATDLDIRFMIPYFDGILKEMLGGRYILFRRLLRNKAFYRDIRQLG